MVKFFLLITIVLELDPTLLQIVRLFTNVQLLVSYVMISGALQTEIGSAWLGLPWLWLGSDAPPVLDLLAWLGSCNFSKKLILD